jgi:hypothetical protein
VNNQTAIALSALALLFAGQASFAQSVTPMRAVAKSQSEEFAVRLTVGNPYEKAVDFDVFAYDENFEPIEAVVAPSKLRISSRETRQVVVRVPFLGTTKRKVRVCAEGLFKQSNNTAVRTQVCGRFLGQRIGS